MEITIILIFAVALFLIFRKYSSSSKIKQINVFMPEWRILLLQHVVFYDILSDYEKQEFENRILQFLNTTRITGIETEVEDLDRLLIASSAIIPIFSFKNWEYKNLKEVLLYPAAFNEKFETNTSDGSILGMVGTGYMEGKMILSKPSLRQRFKNESDKKNVGIHEFVHLIDKMDGSVDGVPEILLKQQHTIPWIDLIRRKMMEIHEGNTDINPYGGVNEAEFFSVTSEYFFERPKLMKRNHPKLYELMEEIFTTNLAQKYAGERKLKKEIGRNDKCPCGSGKKFKVCCGKL